MATNDERLELKKKQDRQLQLMVGRVKKLGDEGFNTTEIAERLNLKESTVRSAETIIKKAEANMAAKNSM